MALFDSADLLARAKRALNRPSTDEALADTDWYAFLTEAQLEAVLYLAPRIPDQMMGNPTQLTTADSGKTYTFGTDADTANIVALGHYRLYDIRENIPDYPLIEGVDYTVEGSKIRIPNNIGRNFDGSGGPWGQWVNPPGLIGSGGSAEPTLLKPARGALVWGACERAAVRLRMDPAEYAQRFRAELDNALTALTVNSFGRGGNPVSARNYRMRYRWGLGR